MTLLVEGLFGQYIADPATAPTPYPRLLATVSEAPPLPPVFALVKPPGWEAGDAERIVLLGYDFLKSARGGRNGD